MANERMNGSLSDKQMNENELNEEKKNTQKRIKRSYDVRRYCENITQLNHMLSRLKLFFYQSDMEREIEFPVFGSFVVFFAFLHHSFSFRCFVYLGLFHNLHGSPYKLLSKNKRFIRVLHTSPFSLIIIQISIRMCEKKKTSKKQKTHRSFHTGSHHITQKELNDIQFL